MENESYSFNFSLITLQTQSIVQMLIFLMLRIPASSFLLFQQIWPTQFGLYRHFQLSGEKFKTDSSLFSHLELGLLLYEERFAIANTTHNRGVWIDVSLVVGTRYAKRLLLFKVLKFLISIGG